MADTLPVKSQPFSIYGTYISGVQARIMLQLAIASSYGLDQIRALFEDDIRQAVYGPRAGQQWYYDARS